MVCSWCSANSRKSSFPSLDVGALVQTWKPEPRGASYDPSPSLKLWNDGEVGANSKWGTQGWKTANHTLTRCLPNARLGTPSKLGKTGRIRYLFLFFTFLTLFLINFPWTGKQEEVIQWDQTFLLQGGTWGIEYWDCSSWKGTLLVSL